LPPSASAVVKQEITDQLKRARDLYQENKLDAAEVIVNHVLRLDDENLAARSLKMHIQTRRNQELFDPDPKPRDPRSSPEPLSPVQPTQPIVQQVAKMKDCPWSLQVEMIDGQTVVTATVHKKHMFHITCQTLDLQTGKRELKASGKVQIGGDMMSGSCDHLAISLTDDRLVLEGAAEVTIQKLSTNVSETKPASFELKGQRLDLRISELPSIRPMPAGLRQVGDVTPAYLPTLPSKSVSMQTNARPAESGRKWTPYGTLRRVESKVYLAGEGEMVWSLDDARGVSLVMIVARDGGTLMQYEGQRISALGSPEMIKGATFLRVTHIALP
jgi:hypothetical protein